MATRITIDPSELTCSICLEVFTDPRILPCVHSFCFDCLEGWAKQFAENNTITCPLCQEDSLIPHDSIKNIKINYFFADLVERMSNNIPEKSKKSKQKWSVCSTDDCIQMSVQYCTAGCGDLCEECYKNHRRARRTKDHRVVPLDKALDMKLSEVPPRHCKKHPRNIVDQFCIDCNLAACDTCLLRKHRHHNLVDLAEQAETSRKQLESILKKTKVIIKLIDEQIANSDKQAKQSSDDIHNTKQHINKVIDGMINKLNKQRKQLFTSLEQIEDRKEKVLMSVRDGQEFNKAAVTSLRTYTDNVLRHGRDCDRVQQVGDIQSRLVSVNTARTPSFVWRHHDNKGVQSQDNMKVARVSIKTEVIDSEADVRVAVEIPLIQQDLVAGLVVINQTVWVVHHKKSSVQAYNTTSPHLPQTISLKGLTDPYDMVRFPPEQSQLVISDDKKKRLLWVKLDQPNVVWSVASKSVVKVSYSPLGLGVSDNQLLVCDDNVIHVLSTSGEETHRVNMPRGVEPSKAVAQLMSPGFVIMDNTNNQIVLLSENGEIQKTYKRQKGCRYGAIVCQEHSIYIADSNNDRVDELSVDGRHIRKLIRGHSISWPSRMCVDDTGRLYLAQGEPGKEEVWVIETKTTPNDSQIQPVVLLTHQSMEMSVTWWN